jgi:hypothetical protein
MLAVSCCPDELREQLVLELIRQDHPADDEVAGCT